MTTPSRLNKLPSTHFKPGEKFSGTSAKNLKDKFCTGNASGEVQNEGEREWTLGLDNLGADPILPLPDGGDSMKSVPSSCEIGIKIISYLGVVKMKEIMFGTNSRHSIINSY